MAMGTVGGCSSGGAGAAAVRAGGVVDGGGATGSGSIGPSARTKEASDGAFESREIEARDDPDDGFSVDTRVRLTSMLRAVAKCAGADILSRFERPHGCAPPHSTVGRYHGVMMHRHCWGV